MEVAVFQTSLAIFVSLKTATRKVRRTKHNILILNDINFLMQILLLKSNFDYAFKQLILTLYAILIHRLVLTLFAMTSQPPHQVIELDEETDKKVQNTPQPESTTPPVTGKMSPLGSSRFQSLMEKYQTIKNKPEGGKQESPQLTAIEPLEKIEKKDEKQDCQVVVHQSQYHAQQITEAQKANQQVIEVESSSQAIHLSIQERQEGQNKTNTTCQLSGLQKKELIEIQEKVVLQSQVQASKGPQAEKHVEILTLEPQVQQMEHSKIHIEYQSKGQENIQKTLGPISNQTTQNFTQQLITLNSIEEEPKITPSAQQIPSNLQSNMQIEVIQYSQQYQIQVHEPQDLTQKKVVQSMQIEHKDEVIQGQSNMQKIKQRLEKIKNKIVQYLPEMQAPVQAMTLDQISDIVTAIKKETGEDIVKQINQTDQHENISSATQTAHQNLTTVMQVDENKTIGEHPNSVNETIVDLQVTKNIQEIESNPTLLPIELKKDQIQRSINIQAMEVDQIKATDHISISDSSKSEGKYLVESNIESVIQNRHDPKEMTFSQTHSAPLTLQNTQVKMVEHVVMPSRQEMFSKLVSLMPEIENDLKTIQDLKTIHQIYVQAFPGIHQEQQKSSESKQVKKPSLTHCVQVCVQKYPHIAQEIKKMTEQQIRQLFDKAQQINTTQPTTQQPEKVVSPSKRTYKEMQSSNAENPQSKQSEASGTQAQGKKSSIVDFKGLRQKLIGKLPEHRQTIMKMNDKDLQKIYRQSMGSAQQRQKPDMNKKATKKKENPKPVIVMSNKNIPEISSDVIADASIQAHLNTPKTQVFELNSSSAKKKKVKTFVLMHIEEEQDDQPTAINQKESGVERIRKESQENDIGAILKKLAAIMSGK